MIVSPLVAWHEVHDMWHELKDIVVHTLSRSTSYARWAVCLSVRLCGDKPVCRAADAVALWHETNGTGHVIQLVTYWQDVTVYHLPCKAKHDLQHHRIHICYMDLTNDDATQCKSALTGNPYKHCCSSNACILKCVSGILNLLLQVT